MRKLGQPSGASQPRKKFLRRARRITARGQGRAGEEQGVREGCGADLQVDQRDTDLVGRQNAEAQECNPWVEGGKEHEDSHTPGTDKDCFHRTGTVDVDVPLGIKITNCSGEVVQFGDGDVRKSGKNALTVLAPGDLPRNRVLPVVSIELLAGLQ